MAEEGNSPIKLLQSNRASAFLRAALRFRVPNYVPFFFSALFNFSTSEVPGSPPSTSLARQALGHRCQARIASATLFLFGGVFTELASAFAAAATESMAAPPGDVARPAGAPRELREMALGAANWCALWPSPGAAAGRPWFL